MSFLLSTKGVRGGSRFNMSVMPEDGLYDLSAFFDAAVRRECKSSQTTVQVDGSAPIAIKFNNVTFKYGNELNSDAAPLYTADISLDGIAADDLNEFLATGHNPCVSRAIGRLTRIIADTIDKSVEGYADKVFVTFYPSDTYLPHMLRVAYMYLTIQGGKVTLQSETSFVVSAQ